MRSPSIMPQQGSFSSAILPMSPRVQSSSLHSPQGVAMPMGDTWTLRFGKAAELPSEQPVVPVGDAELENERKLQRRKHLIQGIKSAVLIPVLPLVGYLALDATGVTDALAQLNPAIERILGEGFGHAGMCFSLHYVIDAGKAFFKAARGGR